MHPSVMTFLKENLFEAEFKGKSVLEVGSYDVNGSPRSVILPLGPASYMGVDFQSGPGVDRIADASLLAEEFGPSSFDIVISTEMLEHASDWRGAVRSMKSVLKPNGLLVVTTRGPGFPYHGYPHDYWRFTESTILGAFGDFECLIFLQDPQFPGVFLKARKPDPFHELDLSDVHPESAPKQ